MPPFNASAKKEDVEELCSLLVASGSLLPLTEEDPLGWWTLVGEVIQLCQRSSKDTANCEAILSFCNAGISRIVIDALLNLPTLTHCQPLTKRDREKV